MPRSANRAPVELPLPLLARLKEAARDDGLTTAAATVIAVREWLERRKGQTMSTKTRFITAQQAPRVVALLQEHGYDVSLDVVKNRYAYNVARDVDLFHAPNVEHIIDVAIDGSYTEAEGYPADLPATERLSERSGLPERPA